MIFLLFFYTESIRIAQWAPFPPETPENVAVVVEDRRSIGEAIMREKLFLFSSPESSAVYMKENLIYNLFNSGRFKNVIPIDAEVESLLITNPGMALSTLNRRNIKYLILVALDRYGMWEGRIFVARFEIINIETGIPVKSGFISKVFKIGKNRIFTSRGAFFPIDQPDKWIFKCIMADGKPSKYYYDLISHYSGRKTTDMKGVRYIFIPYLAADASILINIHTIAIATSDKLDIGSSLALSEFSTGGMFVYMISSNEYIHSDNYKYTGFSLGMLSGWIVGGGIFGFNTETLFAIGAGGILGSWIGKNIKTGHHKDRTLENIIKEDLRIWSFY